MIISHSRKFIYIHLEKCGGTSIENALDPYLGFNDRIFGSTEVGDMSEWVNFSKFGMRNVRNNMLWKHSTARQAYRFIGPSKWDDYRKISVVRDPISLGKSLFSFAEKVVSYHIGGNPDESEWRRIVKRDGFPDIWPYSEDYVRSYITAHVNRSKFDGFIEDIIYKDYDCFSPYSERLKPSFRSPDFGTVYDLSQINEKWPELCAMVGIDNPPPLEALNTSSSGALHISEWSKSMMRKRFAPDYEIIPKYTGVYWE